MTEFDEASWTTWQAYDLDQVVQEPFLWSLWKYRKRNSRHLAFKQWQGEPNLIGSRDWLYSDKGKRRMILDLDVPHSYVTSSNPDHGHLFIDVRMSWWRWALALIALRIAGVLETGFVVWSLRRGENFVRRPGTPKSFPLPPPQQYGWIFKKRRQK